MINLIQNLIDYGKKNYVSKTGMVDIYQEVKTNYKQSKLSGHKTIDDNIKDIYKNVKKSHFINYYNRLFNTSIILGLCLIFILLSFIYYYHSLHILNIFYYIICFLFIGVHYLKNIFKLWQYREIYLHWNSKKTPINISFAYFIISIKNNLDNIIPLKIVPVTDNQKRDV